MEKNATSDAPASSSPSTTITVALCGNPRKHFQSFDALVVAGEEHNKRVDGPPQPPQQQPPAQTSSSHSINTTDSKSGAAKLESGATEYDLRESLKNVKFRFVFLNYHTEKREMVLCLPSAEKGFVPTSDAAWKGDKQKQEEAEAQCPVAAEQVDILLHKVASFGTPDAAKAMQRWYKNANHHRARKHLPHIVVMDPLDKVNLLTTRSMLYQLLDKDEDRGRPLALIPRTFLWERPVDSKEASALTPVGIRSFAVMDGKEKRDGLWWIAKPEEGTGPAFTHHLVMWRGTEECVSPAVAAKLPPETNTFIVQEFYASALPVVVKVYCIGPHVFIKVNPTIHLLATLRSSTASLNVPVPMDSQNKSLFSKEALTTDDGTTYAPAPTDMWNRFFAPGTAARENVVRLATSLSSEAGLGLQLFGFDILLLPRYAAHAHQRELSKGIGYRESSDHHSTTDSSPQLQAEAEKDLVMQPSAMFDLDSGAATPLLMESVPVVIDMNFFPGYSGMPSANTDMMELMADLYTRARQASRKVSATSNSGGKSKKRWCNVL